MSSLPHPVDIYVGKQLRMQRSVMGMSQEALAKAVGITFQQVQKYERGINRMSASRLYDFSQVLCVPISYFFEGLSGTGTNDNYTYDDASPALNAVAEGDMPGYVYEQQAYGRETLELMRRFHKLRGPMKDHLIGLMRAVLNEQPANEAQHEPA